MEAAVTQLITDHSAFVAAFKKHLCSQEKVRQLIAKNVDLTEREEKLLEIKHMTIDTVNSREGIWKIWDKRIVDDDNREQVNA